MGQPINKPTNSGFNRRRARAFKIRRDTTRPDRTVTHRATPSSKSRPMLDTTPATGTQTGQTKT